MKLSKSLSLLSVCGVLSALSISAFSMNATAVELSDFEPCKDGAYRGASSSPAQCATFTVLENRAKPKGKKLDLSVVRLPASKPEGNAPIVILNGGPGGPNLSHPLQTDGILSRYDIILLGYRGTEGDHLLDCPEIKEAASVTSPLSKEARHGVAVATKACATRLQEQGLDLTKYTMVDVIEDYEELRSEMGIKKYNLFSVSYGTRVAQYYTRLYPESVERSVQVAVNPPGHFQWSPEINHSIMELYSKFCAQDSYCSSRTDDLLSDTLNILSQPNLEWQSKPIDMDKIRVGAFALLMSKHSSVRLFDAVLDAKEGNTQNLYRMQGLYDGFVRGTIWGDLFSKGGVDYVDTDLEEFSSSRFTTSQKLGSPMDLVYSSGINEWPIQPAPDGFNVAAMDNTPTLLINGNLDMSTPLAPIKDELLKFLPNGHLVVPRHFGHGDIRTPEIAAEMGRLVEEFLGEGTVDHTIITFRKINFKVD